MKKLLPIFICVILIISIIGNVFLYISNGDATLSLQKSEKELSTAKTTLSEKETELSEANDNITELEGNVTDLQNQITDLEKQIQELKDKLAQAEKAEREETEREETEREEAEKKEAEEQAAKTKVENKSNAQKTYEEWDISGYVLGEDEVFGEDPLNDLGEFNLDGVTGDYSGITIY